MALQKVYTDPYGCEHSDAYWKLDFYAFDLSAEQGRMEFAIYHNEAARNSNKKPIPSGGQTRLGVTFTNESANSIPSVATVLSDMAKHGPRKALYLIAKQLPEFAGSVDVLEDGQAVE